MATYAAIHIQPEGFGSSHVPATHSGSKFIVTPYNLGYRSGYPWPTFPATVVPEPEGFASPRYVPEPTPNNFTPSPYNAGYRIPYPWPSYPATRTLIVFGFGEKNGGESLRVELPMEHGVGADSFYGHGSATDAQPLTTGSHGIGIAPKTAMIFSLSTPAKFIEQDDPGRAEWNDFTFFEGFGAVYNPARMARGGKDGKTLVFPRYHADIGGGRASCAWTSTDNGRTWVTMNAPEGLTGMWNCVIWTGKHFVMSSAQLPNGGNRMEFVLLSEDGLNWRKVPTPVAPENVVCRAMAVDGPRVVIAGDKQSSNDYGAPVFVSENHGETWRRLGMGYGSTTVGNTLHSWKGMFVMASGGAFYYTRDLVTWTRVDHSAITGGTATHFISTPDCLILHFNYMILVWDGVTLTKRDAYPEDWKRGTNRKFLGYVSGSGGPGYLFGTYGDQAEMLKIATSSDYGLTWFERSLSAAALATANRYPHQVVATEPRELTNESSSTNDEQRTTMMMESASGSAGDPINESLLTLEMETASGESFQTLPENGESSLTVMLETGSGSAQSVVVESTATVPAVTGSGAGKTGQVGSSSRTLSMFGTVGTGKAGGVGSSSTTLLMPATTGAAQQFIVQSSVTLQMEQANGADKFLGSSSVTLLKPTGTGTASQNSFISQVTLGMEQTSGTAYSDRFGSSSASLLLPAASGTGAWKFNNGTSAQIVPIITGSSYALDGEIGSSSKVMPAILTNSSGVSGAIGSSSATPKAVLASGTAQNITYSTSSIRVPLVVAHGEGYTEAVGHSVTVELPVIARGRALRLTDEANAATVVMQTENMAVSSYSNFTFNSFARFQGKTLGANSNGVYRLGGDTDDEEPIAAAIKTGVTDYGTEMAKRIEKMYVGYTATGDLVLHVSAGDATYEYPLKKVDRNSLHTAQVQVGKGLKARYWQYELRNTAGADFEFDSISVEPEVLKRRA